MPMGQKDSTGVPAEDGRKIRDATDASRAEVYPGAVSGGADHTPPQPTTARTRGETLKPGTSIGAIVQHRTTGHVALVVAHDQGTLLVVERLGRQAARWPAHEAEIIRPGRGAGAGR